MSPISPTGTSLKAARPPVVGPEVVSGCGQHCLTDLLSSVKNVKSKVKIWEGGGGGGGGEGHYSINFTYLQSSL